MSLLKQALSVGGKKRLLSLRNSMGCGPYRNNYKSKTRTKIKLVTPIATEAPDRESQSDEPVVNLRKATNAVPPPRISNIPG